MDILAAISLGTEPIQDRDIIPVANVEKRISRAAKIFELRIWKNILIQGTYQIVICLVLIYTGALMFFDETGRYNLVTTQKRNPDGSPSALMKINTMVFFTFIIMNIFNQINCRVGDYFQMNFVNFLVNNLIFWVVIIFEVGLTHVMLLMATGSFGSTVLGLAEMTPLQYILGWVFGVLTVPLYIVTNRFIDDKKFTVIMNKLDLEGEDVIPEKFRKWQKKLENSTQI